MLKRIKLAAVAALLTALTTTAAHANLIQVGAITDDPLVFSTTFHFNPGLGGSDTYSSPDGANWSISVQPDGDQLLASIRHMVAPHGQGEAAPSTVIFGFNFSPTSPVTLSSSAGHNSLPDHKDNVSLRVESLTPTAPIWVITISGFHSPREVPGVPDAASTVILLGLGLTTLGAGRRLVRL